jgi:hypothetical protein
VVTVWHLSRKFDDSSEKSRCGNEVSAKIGCALISSNAVSGEYTKDQTIAETEEQI